MDVCDIMDIHGISCAFDVCTFCVLVSQHWKPVALLTGLTDWPAKEEKELDKIQHDKTSGVYYIDRCAPAKFLGSERGTVQEQLKLYFPKYPSHLTPHDDPVVLANNPHAIANLALWVPSCIPRLIVKRTQHVFREVRCISWACMNLHMGHDIT